LVIGENIIDICEEIGEGLNVVGDPQDQGHESAKKSAAAATTKAIAPIYMMLPVDGDDLLNLPSRMHWDKSIRVRDVRFP
jgi:hypothetical protein